MDRDLIARALLEYRCVYTYVDDGDDLNDEGFPLVDKLTPTGQRSLTLGKKEIEALADHLADALSAAPPVQATCDSEFLRGFISRSGRPDEDALLAHCALERLAAAPQQAEFVKLGPADKGQFDAVWFCSDLKLVMQARNASAGDVCEATGVSNTTLSRLRAGTCPDAANLAALSAWAGLNPATYFTGQQDESAPWQVDAEYEKRMREYLTARGVPPQIIERSVAIARSESAPRKVGASEPLTEREEFEAWYCYDCETPASELAWLAWKAARAALQQELKGSVQNAGRRIMDWDFWDAVEVGRCVEQADDYMDAKKT